MVQVATSSLARAAADFAAKFVDTRKRDLEQIRRIIDKVDGAVGGARGESGLHSVQPPMSSPEELNFGGFERPVPTRVDHLKGQVEPPPTVIPVPLCLMPVSVSDPFQASESCRLDANLLALLTNQQDQIEQSTPARFSSITQLTTQLLPGPMPADHPEKTSRCFWARTRLASDVGSGKMTSDGLFGCLKKTAAGSKGFFSLRAGFGVSPSEESSRLAVTRGRTTRA